MQEEKPRHKHRRGACTRDPTALLSSTTSERFDNPLDDPSMSAIFEPMRVFRGVDERDNRPKLL